MMMYQLPIDMMTRIASVVLATQSPPFQRASRPYGLSTISGAALAVAAGAAAATGAGAAAGAAGAAGAAAGAGVCASAAGATMAAGVANSRTAASVARRVIFSMMSPDNGYSSE